MEPEQIHLSKYHGTHGYNFLLLLLPLIVFVLTLAFLVSRLDQKSVASTEQPSVLGEEAR